MDFSIRALEYIRNTNGGATVTNFEEDHSPIGMRLWGKLIDSDLAFVGFDGRIRLTDKGKATLASKERGR